MSIFNWLFKTKQTTNKTAAELEAEAAKDKEFRDSIFFYKADEWASQANFFKAQAEEKLKNRVERQEYEKLRDDTVMNYLLEQSNKVKTFLEGYDTITYAEMDCDYAEIFTDINVIPEFLEAFGKDFDYAYNISYGDKTVTIYAKLKRKFHLTFEERYGKESDTDTCEICGKTKEECTCKKCTCNGGKCTCGCCG